MATIGEIIYEDSLYKFTGRSRSILWGKGNPWRPKYCIIKRLGNRPVLEYFNKKPTRRNAAPKGKTELWPSFRVEKITNMKNRAYVFQVTTPDTTLCFSADDQRTMDMFVFFLQLQCRLKDQIKEDFFPVQPENSEAQRRIGARGTNALLHISPFGVTLALQSNRAVLAQWPLKSIRCYESTDRGQLSLEAGRVAPMGDGMYIFNTEENGDNKIYDLMDRYVMDTLGSAQPEHRGNSMEIEDYVLEAEKLLALTVVSACTADSPDVRNTVLLNWSTQLQAQSATRPKQVVHTKRPLVSQSSVDSQNSFPTSTSAPARVGENGGMSSPAHVPNSLPGFRNSPMLPREGSNPSFSDINTRPPLPPPSSSIPGTPKKAVDPYMRMHSSASASSGSPASPFSPSSADWVPPPDFKDVMRQKSKFASANNGLGVERASGSYMLPSSPIATASPDFPPGDQYLTPLYPGSMPKGAKSAKSNGVKPKEVKSMKNSGVKPKKLDINAVVPKQIDTNNEVHAASNVYIESNNPRLRRLRSVSCDDLSDYLRSVVYDPISKSTSDLLDGEESDDENLNPEPFPRLHTFSAGSAYPGSLMYGGDNFYNIEGLKGKIYDGPGMSVDEIRRKFSKRSQSRIRRSVSNPNFLMLLNKQKLHSARVSAGFASPEHRRSTSSSLVNLLPETLKKHLTKDSSHKGSHSTLSSGTASPHSSRASSARTSPYNSLSKKHKHATPKDDVIAETNVKGIYITRRSRSFRKQKHQNGEPDQQNEKTEDQSSSKIDDQSSSQATGTDAHGELTTESGEVTLDSSTKPANGELVASAVSESVQLSARKTVPRIAPKPKPTVYKKNGDEETATTFV